MIRVLPELGFTHPTEIQKKAIPVLTGEMRDFIGLAQTGTGKTAAFGLPLIQAIDTDIRSTQAIIMVPTRELCQQIDNELKSFSKYIPAVKQVAVYGGVSIVPQLKSVKGNNHIIIATPGRLLDLIRRNAVNFTHVKFMILDEADEMLNMGFKEDIDAILANAPQDTLKWLFSATMPQTIRNIVKKYMTNPFEVQVNPENKVNENIEHQYVVVKGKYKAEALKRIIDMEPEMRGIVFCRTKRDTEQFSSDLQKAGYPVDMINGDLSQNQRDNVMKKFKQRDINLLIATDVAARGIDVNNLSHVIHFSLPDDSEYYTHRSGRTARAGKKGISLALISSSEIGKIKMLEKKSNIQFDKKILPSAKDIMYTRILTWAGNIASTGNEKILDRDVFEQVKMIFKDVDKEALLEKLVLKEIGNLGIDKLSGELDREHKRERNENKVNDPNQVRFYINIGLVDQINENDLIHFIKDRTRLKKEHINTVDLKDKHAYFHIHKKYASNVSDSFKGLTIDGRAIRVNRDNVNGNSNRRKKSGRKAA